MESAPGSLKRKFLIFSLASNSTESYVRSFLRVSVGLSNFMKIVLIFVQPKCTTKCIFVEDVEVALAEVLLSVPHVQQRYSWDCGLASVEMLLR